MGETIKERVARLEEQREADIAYQKKSHELILIKIGECKTLISNHLHSSTWMNRALIGAFITAVAPYVVYGGWKIIQHVFMGS